VARYLASLATTGLSVSTIGQRAAAIRYAHKLAGADTPTSREEVRATVSGIRRTLCTAPDKKPSPGSAGCLAAIPGAHGAPARPPRRPGHEGQFPRGGPSGATSLSKFRPESPETRGCFSRCPIGKLSALSRGVNRPTRALLRVVHRSASYPVGRTGPKCGENRCDSWLSRGENRTNY